MTKKEFYVCVQKKKEVIKNIGSERLEEFI